ncbi:hypothetical protein C8J56DRAFT_203458 [Mycena floridula]|nr:hypothetical protein C8J56DRAFT_203458 [Mycena floridula]
MENDLRTATADLLDCPDEIILRVVENNDAIELYVLSLVCRRLHYICLPLFLSRHRVRNPKESVDITLSVKREEVDIISGLRLALFITSIRHIGFSYSPYINCDSGLNTFCSQLGRFHDLLAKLTVVDEIDIELGRLCDLCIKESMRLQEIFNLVQRILDLAVSKSCTSLIVSGRCWKDIVHFEHTWKGKSWLRRHFTSAKNLIGAYICSSDSVRMMAADGWRFSVDPGNGAGKQSVRENELKLSPIAVRSNTSLTALSIRSSLLLMPPLLSWTLGLLSLPSLTKLDMSGVCSSLPDDAWPTVLQSLAKAARNVTELSISQCDIHMADLRDFLWRLPQLKSLRLDDEFLQDTIGSEARQPEFRFLKELHAPIRIVQQLLIHKPNVFPSLESLSLPTTTPDLRALDQSLSICVHHILAVAGRHSSAPRSLPAISLDMHYGYQNDVQDDMDQYFDKDSHPPSDVFQHVSELSLNIRWANHADNPFAALPRVTVTQAVCDWIGLFKTLRHATIMLRVFDEDTEKLILGIRKSCPCIQTLDLNGTKYNWEKL